MGLLALTAQSFQHEDAVILGDVTGLRMLRHAIDVALAEDISLSETVEPGDGEGYRVRIALVTPNEIEGVKAPYTDEEFCPPKAGAVHPEVFHEQKRVARLTSKGP